MENTVTQSGKDILASQDVLVSIGLRLREERTRQDIKTADVSAKLRIMEPYIQAIEAGDTSELPTMTYVIGYIRTYASMLGMDAAAICAELKDSLADAEAKPDFNFIENKFESRVGAGRMALVALVVGFVAYGGWYSLSGGLDTGTSPEVAEVVNNNDVDEVITTVNPTQEVVEAEYVAVEPKATSPVINQDLPLVSAEDNTPQKTDDTAPAVKLETASVTTPVIGEDGQNPSPATNIPDPELTASSSAIEPEPTALVPKVTDAQAVNRVPGVEITLKATASSWVEVTRADGSAVTERLMRVGDTYVIPGDEDLFLTTGNAGGLNLTLGGDEPITLGAWGETVRELPLNATIINERY